MSDLSPVTFTRRTQAHTESTDAVEPTETTIVAAALGLSRATGLRTFSLIEETDVVLLVVTQTFGERVKPMDTCVWDGENFVVKRCDVFTPDGPDLIGRVLIGK